MHALAAITGKTTDHGGTEGYMQSNGRGISVCLNKLFDMESFCRRVGVNKGLAGKRIILSGMGKIGYWAAKDLEELGAEIVGVQEVNSAIYNPKGKLSIE